MKPSHYQIQISLVALCVGPIMVILGACESLEALYCQSKWESVPAKVTRAESRRSRSSEHGHSTKHYFDYAYTVNGQRFTGNSTDHGMVSLVLPINLSIAINKYPRGSDITVYYDPNMPQRSVLWNGVPWEGPTLILLGGVFFVGAFLSLQSLRGIKAQGIKAIPKTEETYEPKANEEQEREDAIQQWRENLKQRSH